ncbi:hypothetical protein V1477_010066 [Vespula maculifrons]|uniref:Uncharacterized protein n=1 Tax=Vespula maculifrons TaxID=7453 RepID=A0ABD2CBJ7_VESMC
MKIFKNELTRNVERMQFDIDLFLDRYMEKGGVEASTRIVSKLRKDLVYKNLVLTLRGCFRRKVNLGRPRKSECKVYKIDFDNRLERYDNKRRKLIGLNITKENLKY